MLPKDCPNESVLRLLVTFHMPMQHFSVIQTFGIDVDEPRLIVVERH